ncbi:MAG: hypothetical protein FWF94_01415 [Oscillospiraceae bacterium]|nr:hypothetical protein [Oscillospiraceae bacterium]
MLNTDSQDTNIENETVAEESNVSEGVEYAANEQNEKDFPKKKKGGRVLVLVLILLLITAAVYYFVFGGFSQYGVQKDSIVLHGNNQTFVICNNGDSTMLDEHLFEYRVSLTGDKGAFITNWNYDKNAGNLYYVGDKGRPKRVGENVNGFTMSDSGNGIAYYTDFNIETDTAVLNLYNGTSSSVIDTEAYYNFGAGINTLAISPDGKTICYIKDVQGGNVACISTNGGKGVELKNGSEIMPIAIANEAKYLYYINTVTDQSFYVQKGINGEPQRLGSGSINSAFFNKSYSQIVFNELSDTWTSFISRDGGERKLFVNGQTVDFIIPQKGQAVENDFYKVFGFSDFKNKVFSSDGGLFVVNGKYSSERISQSMVKATLSKNGRRVFFMSGDRLLSASVSNPDGKKIVFAESAKDFVLTSGGSIYYVNDSGVLYRQSSRNAYNNPEGIWVTEFVSAESLSISGKGVVYFLNRDGYLVSVTGKSRHRIRGNVERIRVYNNNALYFIDEGDGYYDVYRSGGGNSFKRIFIDAKLFLGSDEPEADFRDSINYYSENDFRHFEEEAENYQDGVNNYDEYDDFYDDDARDYDYDNDYRD